MSLALEMFAIAPVSGLANLTAPQRRFLTGKARWIRAVHEAGLRTVPTIVITRAAWNGLTRAEKPERGPEQAVQRAQVRNLVEARIDRLPEVFRICLYRTIQEALTNCLRHAQATRVSITVKQEKDLVFASIQDNGIGFEASSLRTGGLGLVGMEERVRTLQGEMRISSNPGHGTLVEIELPLLPMHQAEALA